MQVKSNLEQIVSLDPHRTVLMSHLIFEVHERIRRREQEQTKAKVLYLNSWMIFLHEN